MKAKVINTGEIVEVYERYDDFAGETRFEPIVPYYRPDELDFDVPQDATEEVTIEGYAARWHDGEITVFQKEPYIFADMDNGTERKFYGSQDECKLFLPNDALPSVTYKNSPKKVKITITPMEE